MSESANHESRIRHSPFADSLFTWRLLIHGAASGALNMAVDEAISRLVAEGTAPPTLRFYAWTPPCISLGRHQPAAAVDAPRCRALGYEIVRRPTGGRAILHTDEFTYSAIATPDQPPMQGLVLDSYLQLSRGLVAGLARLGIAAEPAPGTNRAGPNASAACFEVPSAYELVAAGRKLLGSAQNRRAKVVLQHGSLPLHGDLTRLVECLALPNDAEREALRHALATHAGTVEQVLGRRVGFDEVATAMQAGFSEALGLALTPGELSPAELALADKLVREQYGAPAWTDRV
jgi:lipoate-protein ligase A